MIDEEVQQLCKIPAIARIIALEEIVMVNLQVFLLKMTVEAGIPGDVMQALIDGKNMVSVPRNDILLVDLNALMMI